MKNENYKIGLCVFVVFGLASLMPAACFAQSKCEKEEEVKVMFLGSWRDGTVVDVKKKQVLVDFYFGNSPKQEVFNRNNVRRLYEVDAVDYGRNWQSTAGTKIDAALKDLVDEDVVLILPDLNELTVPLSKLSPKDVNYVKKMKKNYDKAVRAGAVPARTPELPKLENYESGVSFFNESTESGIKPLGAIPSYLKDFSQAGFGFNMVRKDQDLVSVIPVGGPDQLVLMTARESRWFDGPKFQSQLYWVSLKQKKLLNSVPITHEDYAIDYDPRYKLLLTFNEKATFKDEDDPDHYTMWKIQPGEDKAEPIQRWSVPTSSFETRKAYAKIINERIVLTKTESQTYVAWDMVEKKSAYMLKTQSFFDVPVVVSPDRKHIIIPEDGQVTVVDALTGDSVFTANVPDRHCSGANINSDGTKLAAITERNIYVWDLNSSQTEPTVYPAPLMASPFSARVEWIGNDHILGESHSARILYRLSLKLPVWSYKMDVGDYFLNRDPRKNMVVDDMFFYVSQPNGPFAASIAVGAVELPGPQVNEITQNIDPKSLLIMKPGVPVGIQMTGVTDESAVQTWLDEKIKENGWVRDDNAEIQLQAIMGVGQQQTVQYEYRQNGETTSATFRPHYSRLKIVKGKVIIWQTGTSTGAPPVIMGDNVQSKLNSYQKPNLNFFKSVKMDTEIIDPKYSRGFGESKLGLRGIQVVSTSPPGREGDPMAAAAQAEEDEKKSLEDSKKRAEENKQNGSDTGVSGSFGRG